MMSAVLSVRLVLIPILVMNVVMLGHIMLLVKEHLSSPLNQQKAGAVISNQKLLEIKKSRIAGNAKAILRSNQVPEINQKKLKSPRKTMPHRPTLNLIVSNTPMVISRRTRFMHSGITTIHWSDSKRNGLITKTDIESGDILLREEPILFFKSDVASMQFAFQKAVTAKYVDPTFRRIWDSMNAKQALDHLVQFDIGRVVHRVAVFQMFSTIIHGKQPNVMAIFGEQSGECLCTVMAIVDIPRGSRLVWNTPSIPDQIKQLVHSGEIFKNGNRNDEEMSSSWKGNMLMKKALCELHAKKEGIRNVEFEKWCLSLIYGKWRK